MHLNCIFNSFHAEHYDLLAFSMADIACWGRYTITWLLIEWLFKILLQCGMDF